MNVKPGDRVTWIHIPRGGWCLPHPVAALVVGKGRARIKIMAEKTNGELATTYVRPESLRPPQGRVPEWMVWERVKLSQAEAERQKEAERRKMAADYIGNKMFYEAMEDRQDRQIDWE